MPTSLQQHARVWRPGFDLDVAATLSALRRGTGDPAYTQDRDGAIWWAVRTPEGTAGLRLTTDRGLGEVRAAAWGSGAGWMLDRLPQTLGAADELDGFEPRHPLLAESLRRHHGWRVPCTGLVFEATMPAILEQKVTGQEAWLGWRRLLRGYGDRAPGPLGERGMVVPPSPHTVRMIPSWAWLKMRIDPARSRALVTAARVAEALERTMGLPGPEVERRLRSLPGIGVWTAAEIRQRAHGDADAVSFGDYHVAKNVTWALTGEAGDDAAMAELLEPYRPHRFRVQRLLELSRVGPPRRGPRMAPRTHLPG
ncbi:MAG TPA: DNA-3-methyladenine glycosylase 2 family protein [Nocardioidaceae bacterium]|nr:DNA-3-methyladenine glycosylase 2 family protein [Nocardioidaceae bacterium]